MCGRFARYAPIDVAAAAKAALSELDADFDLAAELDRLPPQYNLAPMHRAAVMARTEEHRLAVKELRWGLIPTWAHDAKIGASGLNARAETVDTKPMFRTAFRKRRCVVPMSGYFEWQQTETGTKQPYFIHAADRSALLCAGIWEAWKPKEESASDWLRTFAILTGRPGRVSGDIHDRQPVILPPGQLAAWLDGTPEEARAALDDLPEADLAYYPVTRAVGSARNQGPELVQPLDG